MRTQAPGYLALLYGRARTLASVDLTPANGFSGQTASGSAGVAGVAGVAGSTLETPPPRDFWFVYIDRPVQPHTALSADGEGGMQLAGEGHKPRRTANC